MSFTRFRFEGKLSHVLKERTASMDSIWLGPIDLCYLHFAPSGHNLLRWLRQTDSYLFKLQGGSLRTAAHAAAFLCQFQSAGDYSLSQAFYCVYDLFSNSDVRLKLEIPGATTVQIVSQNETECNDTHWTGAFLSSILRFFYAKGPYIGMAPFDGIEDVVYIVQLALDFPAMNTTHRTLLFHGLSKFLLKRKSFEVHSRVFGPLTHQIPECVQLTADLCRAQGLASKDFLRDIAESPEMGLVLSKFQEPSQAIATIESYMLNYSANFECCTMLAQCFAEEKRFPEALICLNQACSYAEHRPDNSLDRTFWQKPVYFDFKPNDSAVERFLNYEFLWNAHESHFFRGQVKVVYRILVRLLEFLGVYGLEGVRKQVFSECEPIIQTISRTNESVANEHIRSQENSNRLSVGWRQSITGKLSELLTFRVSTLNEKSDNEHPLFLKIYNALEKDAQVLAQWDLNRKLSGEAWISRGWLATCMNQPKKAVLAFKCALAQGSSVFALYQLVKLQTHLHNIEGALESFAEIVKHADEVEVYPDWMFELLSGLCHEFGLQDIIRHSHSNIYAIQSVEQLKRWRTNGIDR